MRILSNEAIQAFPIERETKVDTLTDFDPTNYEIIHAAEDGTITFTFGTSSINVDVLAGQDLAIGSGCTSITSTGTVWIS